MTGSLGWRRRNPETLRKRRRRQEANRRARQRGEEPAAPQAADIQQDAVPSAPSGSADPPTHLRRDDRRTPATRGSVSAAQPAAATAGDWSWDGRPASWWLQSQPRAETQPQSQRDTWWREGTTSWNEAAGHEATWWSAWSSRNWYSQDWSDRRNAYMCSALQCHAVFRSRQEESWQCDSSLQKCAHAPSTCHTALPLYPHVPPALHRFSPRPQQSCGQMPPWRPASLILSAVLSAVRCCASHSAPLASVSQDRHELLCCLPLLATNAPLTAWPMKQCHTYCSIGVLGTLRRGNRQTLLYAAVLSQTGASASSDRPRTQPCAPTEPTPHPWPCRRSGNGHASTRQGNNHQDRQAAPPGILVHYVSLYYILEQLALSHLQQPPQWQISAPCLQHHQVFPSGRARTRLWPGTNEMPYPMAAEAGVPAPGEAANLQLALPTAAPASAPPAAAVPAAGRKGGPVVKAAPAPAPKPAAPQAQAVQATAAARGSNDPPPPSDDVVSMENSESEERHPGKLPSYMVP